jgi:hypothetical protein
LALLFVAVDTDNGTLRTAWLVPSVDCFEDTDQPLRLDRGELVAHAASTATRSRRTVGTGQPSSCMTSR